MDLSPTPPGPEQTRIGLDDEALRASLSREAAASLLRLCAATDDRIYSNVQVLSVPNGSSLYIKSYA